MSKSNAFETDMLELYFQAVTHANLAEDVAASPAANITVALHTADPGEAGDQSTSEIAYTGYARINVVRTTGGWAISGDTITPVANIDFGEMTGGAGGTVTFFSVGTGTGDYMMYSGSVAPTIVVTTGVTPRLTTATAIDEN